MPRHAFYRFFVGDYLRDAGHLSLLEHGAYRRLIDLYMIEGGPFEFDLARIYRLLHATSKEEQQAVQTVLEEFFVAEGIGSGKLRHKRCDREIAWQDHTSEVAKQAVERREIYKKQRIENDRSSIDDPSIIERSTSQSQSQRKSQKEKEKKPPPTSPWKCPTGVTVEAWNAWLDVRKRLHSPMTEFAYKRAMTQLVGWTEAGHNPDAIVAASAANGWKGLFEPKGKPVPAGPKDGDKRMTKWGEEIYENGGWTS